MKKSNILHISILVNFFSIEAQLIVGGTAVTMVPFAVGERHGGAVGLIAFQQEGCGFDYQPGPFFIEFASSCFFNV